MPYQKPTYSCASSRSPFHVPRSLARPPLHGTRYRDHRASLAPSCCRPCSCCPSAPHLPVFSIIDWGEWGAFFEGLQTRARTEDGPRWFVVTAAASGVAQHHRRGHAEPADEINSIVKRKERVWKRKNPLIIFALRGRPRQQQFVIFLSFWSIVWRGQLETVFVVGEARQRQRERSAKIRFSHVRRRNR